MANQITNYKCPACTGPLHFSGESGKLECEYCGSAYEPTEIEALYAEKEEAAAAAFEQAEQENPAPTEEAWNTDAAGSDWGKDAQGMRAYSCPSCGAELICEETTAATSCPYCGNPTVVPGQFGGTKRPDYIIPFKLDKQAAIDALKKHYQGKFLLPKAFTAGNHIEEVKGVYVPFWLFDATVSVSGNYHASISHTRKEGNYRITDTEHYAVFRSGNISFCRTPVDGSQKMPDDYMDSIEPFDYNELKPFSTAYLPGYLADKYDVTADVASERANMRCTESALDALRDTVTGYADVSLQDKTVALQPGDVKYALMPVWMLTTRWNGQEYLFAMNGQTGKLIGDLPVDKRKKRAVFWGTLAAVTGLCSALFATPLGRLILYFIY